MVVIIQKEVCRHYLMLLVEKFKEAGGDLRLSSLVKRIIVKDNKLRALF